MTTPDAISDPSANQQSAYHLSRVTESANVDDEVCEAMHTYLTGDLGIKAGAALDRARAELYRNIPKAVVGMLGANGIEVAGKRVLDLGAGLGAMSEELVLRGANVTALEPGRAWATLTRRRAERHSGNFHLLHAFGEAIPLPDASVDLIVSLQVLEHVKSPDQVLAEAWRVLRPGGHFYLACENYLAFREAHYRLPWFPLLPKPLGSLYLRLMGRSPAFLQEAVTYTTFPGVVRSCRRLGFVRLRDEEIARNVASKQDIKWRTMRLLAAVFGKHAPRVIDDARNTFRFGIAEVLRKPSV